jgi:hypothetical protein
VNFIDIQKNRIIFQKLRTRRSVLSYSVLLQAWLVGDHLLLRDFEPYAIIFMKAYIGLTVAMAMLFGDFGPHGIIFMTVSLLL